jgi:hypothetical protein
MELSRLAKGACTRSSMKKLTYREVDLFVLPLRDRGYAVGLVARSGPRGRVLTNTPIPLGYDLLQ